MPGALFQPDSCLNGTSSIIVASPLCLPRFKTPEAAGNVRTLTEMYFHDCQSLDIEFDDTHSGAFLLSSCIIKKRMSFFLLSVHDFSFQ